MSLQSADIIGLFDPTQNGPRLVCFLHSHFKSCFYAMCSPSPLLSTLIFCFSHCTCFRQFSSFPHMTVEFEMIDQIVKFTVAPKMILSGEVLIFRVCFVSSWLVASSWLAKVLKEHLTLVKIKKKKVVLFSSIECPVPQSVCEKLRNLKYTAFPQFWLKNSIKEFENLYVPLYILG